MKWGSLLWLGYLAAGEIGRQPKPPLTEEQKRRRQQYIADKKIKRARQLKRMRWEVQQRRQAEREATAPLTSEEIERDAARTRRASLWRLPQLPPTNHIPLGPREPRFALRSFYVSRKHKIAFCAIPKVACTEFIRLMYRLEGDEHWWKDPHFRTDASTLLKKGDEREAEAILNDANWTKVAFLRDPATRALSAYLDKFVDSPSRGIHGNYGLRHFGRELNWTDFVDTLGSENTDRYRPEGLHVGSNAHWKPQRFHCSLEKFLTKYQFIGRYESLRDHAEMLLRSLNLWDAYGSEGWGHRDKRQRLMPKPSDSIPVRDSLFAQKAKHSTNADARKASYLTPSILSKLREIYAMDYEMLAAVDASPDPGNGAGWAPSKRKLCDGVRRDDRRMFGEYCGFGSRARIAREEQRVVLRPPMPSTRSAASRDPPLDARAPLRKDGLTLLDRRDALQT